jgi:hypothetical protein
MLSSLNLESNVDTLLKNRINLMEGIIAAVITTTVGILCGQTVIGQVKTKLGKNKINSSWQSKIERRIENIERTTDGLVGELPKLIGRQEVADALNKVPPIVMQAVQQEMGQTRTVPNQRNAPPQLTADQLRSLQAHEQSMKAMQDAAALLDKFENQQPIDYQRPFPTGEQS